jgi:hypothetical protein
MIPIDTAAVRMFTLNFNHPSVNIIGEIVEDIPNLVEEIDGTTLCLASDNIKVKFPVLCEEVYSNDSGMTYMSTIPSMDEVLEFNKAQILIMPFKPTEKYLIKYLSMASFYTLPMIVKHSRSSVLE